MVDGPLMLELEAQQADADTAEDMDKENISGQNEGSELALYFITSVPQR